MEVPNLCAALKEIAETVGSPAEDGMWDESKHPRKGGRFAKKGEAETYSDRDAVALHEATAKANWEEMGNRQRAHNANLVAVSVNNTPLSDYLQSVRKTNTLLDLHKVVRPGENIKASGIGRLHREQMRQADRRDSRPDYGPSGAKRHEVGAEVKTHPFHQGVIEAYKAIRNEAKNLQ